MRGQLVLFLVILNVVFSAACGSAPPKPEPAHPSRAEVMALTAGQVPEVKIEASRKRVESWRLSDALPEQLGQTERKPESIWEHYVVDNLKGRKVPLAEELHCAGRETQRFVMEHGQRPHESLDAFIRGRCGLTNYQLVWIGWVIEQGSEQEHFEQYNASLLKAVENVLKDKKLEDISINYLNDGSKAHLSIFYGRRRAKLEPMSNRMGKDGKIVIRGEVLTEGGDSVYAMITRGEFDAARCLTDPDIELPRFEVTCQGIPGDTQARVTLNVSRKGKIFGRSLTELLFWGTEPQAEYRASTIRSLLAQHGDVPILGESQLSSALLEKINHVRAYLRYAPLTLEQSQTQTVQRAAPFLFTQIHDDEDLEEERRDKLFRGLDAGWDVSSPITEGYFLTDRSGSDSVVDIVSSFLDEPWGRYMLLQRRADLVAIGGVVSEGRAMVALFTYERLLNESSNKLAGRLIGQLNAARKLNGRKFAKRLSSHNAEAEKTAQKLKDTEDFKGAADSLAGKVSREMGTTRYYHYTVSSLDKLRFAWKLEQAKTLRVVVAVAPYKPEGAAHWEYRVVIIVPKSDFKFE